MSETIEPSELLSALLDGELDDGEAALVRAWLADHPAGQHELENLQRVRVGLRDLPAVDPPFGFYERMLLDGSIEPTESRPTTSARPRRRSWAGMAGLGVAAGAALILVLGVTPVIDRVVPPVNAFAERHDSMTTDAPTAGSTSPTSTSPTSTSPTSTSSTAGSSTSTTAAASGSTAADRYVAIAESELDDMHAPFVAPPRLDGFDRRSAYATNGVVHVMYSHDGDWLSVYEQPGTVDWSSMPPGRTMTVQDNPAWEATVGRQVVLVIDQDGMVVTVVSSAPTDAMMRAATSVPNPQPASMTTRMRRGADNLVRNFGGFG